MRYYWEALFSVEYFTYWEFSMLMMLVLVLSVLWRINRIERKLDGLIDDMWHVIKDIAED